MFTFKPRTKRENLSGRNGHRRSFARTSVLFTLAIAMSLTLLISGAPSQAKPAGKPDLVVTAFAVTGFRTFNSQGQVELPLLVQVRNQGASAASLFKVSVFYKQSTGMWAEQYFLVPFTVPGQSDAAHAWTSGTLAPGAIVTFNGKAIFPSSLQNATVTIQARADSCAGDEFMPAYCRVDESAEKNNFSNTINVVLGLP